MNETEPAGEDSDLRRQQHVDRVCDQFEAAWKDCGAAALRPRIEDFLADAAEPLREALLPELVALDIGCRRRRGESPVAEDYAPRFPSLDAAWLAATIAVVAAEEDRALRVRQSPPNASLAPQTPDALADAAPPELSGHAPCRFGDYDLLAEIGRGGMGVVYRARHRSLGRIVALKMILAGRWASEQEIQRFLREAAAAANLRHPGIVAIYEVGQHEGQYYLTMEYVEGQSLAKMVRERPLPARQAASYIERVAAAIHSAHQHGTLHRDLKPSNILVDERDAPHVSDFGLAKRLGSDDDPTTVGSLLGTVSYMPPEQAAGRAAEIGPASDVYALGATLYHLLTGRPPFRADSIEATLRQVQEAEPLAPRALNAAVPRDLETICLKCLGKEPSRRYATAAALAEDLGRFLRGEPIEARPVGQVERLWRWCKRRPAVASLAASVVAITIVGFALVTWLWRNAETARQAEAAARAQAQQTQHQHQQIAGRLSLRRGQELCERGDVARGLLWLAYALRIAAEEDADLQWAVRANLAAWRQWHCPLQKVLWHADQATIRAVCVGPEGHRLLALCADDTAHLWAVDGNRRIGQLAGRRGPILAAAFSPAGPPRLVTGGGDKTAQLWDAATATPLGAPWQHNDAVTAVAFSPDGRQVVTGSRDGAVRAWDVAGDLLSLKEAHSDAVLAIRFSPAGNTVATGSKDGGAQLWEFPSWQPAGPAIPAQTAEVWTVDFCRRGELLLTAVRDPEEGANSVVRLWDARSGAPRATLRHPAAAIVAVAIGPEGDRVLTGGEDDAARLWDAATGKELLAAPLPHQDTVASVAFDAAGQVLLTGSHDQTVRLWDARTGRPIGSPVEQQGPVGAAAFVGHGAFLTAANEPVVRVWASAERSAAPSLQHDGQVEALALTADGQTLAAGTSAGTIVLWSVGGRRGDPDRKLFELPAAHHDRIWAMAFTRDGRLLLTADRDKSVKAWKLDAARQGLTPLWTAEPKHPLDSDGLPWRALAVGGSDRTVLVGGGRAGVGLAQRLSIAAGEPRGPPLELDEVVWAVAYGPQPTPEQCAIACGENLVRLWTDVGGDCCLAPPSRHQGRVVALDFSPDGRLLATGSIDRTVRLLETATGQWRGDAIEHPSAVRAVAFSPDGRLLITGCADGGVRFWDVATGTPIGPSLVHHDVVWAVVCGGKDGAVYSGSADGSVQRWDLPAADARPWPQIVREVCVATGMELDDRRAPQWLEPARWQSLRDGR